MNRARELGVGGREFLQPPFSTSFEKIYYKYIPLCSFICLELSFKVSESLTFIIFPGGEIFLVKISKIYTYILIQINII